MSHILRIAGAALNQTPLDWPGNRRRLLAAVDAARQAEVSILCLPELAISGYGCEDAFLFADTHRRSLETLEALRDASQGMLICVGLPLQVANRTYNAAALLHDGQLLGIHPKQNLAGDGVYYEPRWFAAWPPETLIEVDLLGQRVPAGELTVELDGLRIGIEICEDAWRGQRPGHRHYERAVDVLLNPSASHFVLGKSATRRQVVLESSRAFNCTYVLANLLGNEAGRILYDGDVLIAQGGERLARSQPLRFVEHDLIWADVDVDAHRQRARRFFAFRPAYAGEGEPQPVRVLPGALPRRSQAAPAHFPEPPAPSRAWELYQALTLALFDYHRKARARGFVVSLSGGADSSMTIIAAAHAFQRAEDELGREELLRRLDYLNLAPDQPLAAQLLDGVYQATANSSAETLRSAKALAEDLGARFHHWDVQPMVEQYTQQVAQSLGRELTWETDDLALQNIQARARVPALWMLTNTRGALLLATANRSELAVGYTTMDGDTAGGLAPIAGLAKAEVLSWLRWAETELGISALRHVNALQPTAELRPAEQGRQSDEVEMLPFAVLRRIEHLALVEGRSPREIYAALTAEGPTTPPPAEAVRRFFRSWARSQWKRERTALSFHLDEHNLDSRSFLRYPVLNGDYRAELAELGGLS